MGDTRRVCRDGDEGVLKLTNENSSKQAEDFALWCLKGGGESSYEGLLSLMAYGEPKSAENERSSRSRWKWRDGACLSANVLSQLNHDRD